MNTGSYVPLRFFNNFSSSPLPPPPEIDIFEILILPSAPLAMLFIKMPEQKLYYNH